MEREGLKIIWAEHVGAIVHVGLDLTANKEKEFEQEFAEVQGRIKVGRARMVEKQARREGFDYA